MKNFRLSVSKKILFGFLLLIGIFIVNVSISFITLDKNQRAISYSSEEVKPSLRALSNLSHLLISSRMYATNWVYLQTNADDKNALKKIHQSDFPAVKLELEELAKNWENPTHQTELDSLFTDFESLIGHQQEIMKLLVSFDDYQNPLAKFSSEEIIEQKVLPQTAQISERLNALQQQRLLNSIKTDTKLIESFDQLRLINMISGLVTILLGITAAIVMSRSIVNPINSLKLVIQQLGKGILPNKTIDKFKKDEIGEMEIAVDKLVKGLISTSHFAEKIGNGDYNSEYNPLSEHDVLGNALLVMRDNLKKVAEEDKRRNWASNGIAKFSDILRSEHENIEVVANNILRELIHYIDANQGGVFIVNDDTPTDRHLEMVACYAYDRRKFHQKRIDVGEGLVGQCFQEGDRIFLTDIPNEYINITSGLGKATPSCILIVPLNINEEFVGVIELASFSNFEPHIVDFVEKVAESTASSIASVKINNRTKKLLENSQLSTEQLRAQEEEMRQNTEELQATQEEYERRIRELERLLQEKERSELPS